MSLILNIETATTVCSVSLSENERLLTVKELDEGYTHAENLHVFIDQLLGESGLKPSELSAVAVSRGPGSYTGLRIGVSAAKGLAWALKIPLISVDTLQLMAVAARETCKDGVFWPMIDARRMEIYTALYDAQLDQLKGVSALIMDEESMRAYAPSGRLICFGNGMPKCRTLLQDLPDIRFLENVVPSARHMPLLSHARLRAGQTEDIAYFEPYYLKDFYILPKQK